MKRNQTIIGLLWLMLVFQFWGCIEKYEADLNPESTVGLAIEGTIISDSTVVFQLSKTLPIQQTAENTDDFRDYLQVYADLCVKGSDGSCWKGRAMGNGQYQVTIGTLRPDATYQVEILYDGATYQSAPQQPLAISGIESLSFHQPHADAPVTVTLDSHETDLSEPKYYLWFYEEDWEVHALFVTDRLYDPVTDRVVKYSYPPVAQGWCYDACPEFVLGTTETLVENRVKGLSLLNIDNTNSRLSCLYSIRVQQRNLSREEYEYYQVRAKLNNDMGGLFTPQPTELPTNITCSEKERKVIGYVGCNMGVACAQLYIPTEEVNYVESTNCDSGEGPEGKMIDKYAAGYQIAEFFEPSDYIWAKSRCVDVRSLGADPNGRPSWWPNPYIYVNP